MKNQLTETRDKIGQTIKVGSIIAVPVSAGYLEIVKVTKITAKKVMFKNRYRTEKRKDQSEVICLDNIEELSLYILAGEQVV